MGIDIRFMILEKFSDNISAHVRDVLSLSAERALVGPLETRMETGKHWPAIQLPSGANSTFRDGHDSDADVRGEAGWLMNDPYSDRGAGLKSLTGKELRELFEKSPSQYPQNQAIISFMTEMYADNDIVVYFH